MESVFVRTGFVKFSEKDIIARLHLLADREGGLQIECNKEISGIWLHSTSWETKLRLLTLLNWRLTVSRVCFVKRRNETMTAVLEWMKVFR